MERAEPAHHVVVVGGGFGGLYAARRLRKAPCRVTLVDRRNFHLFQPLLYQVATGALSPANIAAPLRALFARQKHAVVLLGNVVGIDTANRRLHLSNPDAQPLHYDTLIVATGSQFNYFGRDDWQPLAPGLKTIEDATDIRRRVLSAFELAELEFNPEKLDHLMTFVVVGGGPTGVELAGAVAEVARHTLKNNFRRIDPTQARIILIEAQDHVLSQFPPELREKAALALRGMGIDLRTGTRVTDISREGVTVHNGAGSEHLQAATVLWTAGVKASSLGAAIATSVGQTADRAGRVVVEPDCTLPGHPEIFVIGDLANYSHQGGQPLPALAPVAMQQGRYVADVIRHRLRGKQAPPAFHYRDKGTMATIGRAQAVADLGWLRISGILAWLVWLFVHILFLVQFQNRVLVLTHWAFSYFTRGRAARLITEPPPASEREPDR